MGAKLEKEKNEIPFEALSIEALPSSLLLVQGVFLFAVFFGYLSACHHPQIFSHWFDWLDSLSWPCEWMCSPVPSFWLPAYLGFWHKTGFHSPVFAFFSRLRWSVTEIVVAFGFAFGSAWRGKKRGKRKKMPSPRGLWASSADVGECVQSRARWGRREWEGYGILSECRGQPTNPPPFPITNRIWWTTHWFKA